MSYKKTKTKNAQNINRRVKNKKKKRKRVNKKKLAVVMIFISILIISVNTAVLGISGIVKKIDDAKKAEIEKQKQIEATKQAELEKEKEETLIKKYVVLIDPGHGGNDPGNLGFSAKKKDSKTKLYEKELTLTVGKKVAAILSNQNDVQVILTRTEDKYVSLEDRVNMANSQKVDAFVSIHMNAESGGNTAYGVETYYRDELKEKDESEKLADTIHETIGSYVKIRDRGVKQQVLQVLRDTNSAAALVECGFITNEKEEQKLLDEQYQNQLSEGIAQGILTFLDEKSKQ